MAFDPFTMFAAKRQEEQDFLSTALLSPMQTGQQVAPFQQPSAVTPKAPEPEPAQNFAPYKSPADQANNAARQEILQGTPSVSPPVGITSAPPPPRPYEQVEQETAPQPQRQPSPAPSVGRAYEAPTPQAPMPYNKEMSRTDSVPALVFRTLTEGGIPPHIAYGFLGNFQTESSFNTGAWNGKEGAYGLGQHRLERLENMRAFAKANKLNIADPVTQAKFYIHELQTTEKAAWEKIKHAKTEGEAAALIDQHWERSDGKARAKRIAAAEAWARGSANLTGTMSTSGPGELSGGGTLDDTWVGENPWLKSEEQKKEQWQPKNWKERILGVEPTSTEDNSPGAQLRRARAMQLQALGVGLGQMSHGQPVDVSSVLDQHYARQKDMREYQKEMAQKAQQNAENARLFEALPPDLQKFAGTQKGMDMAVSVMTERMKKEADPSHVIDQNVLRMAEKYSPDLVTMLQSPDEYTRKQGQETLGNLVQGASAPTGGDKRIMTDAMRSSGLAMAKRFGMPEMEAAIDAGDVATYDTLLEIAQAAGAPSGQKTTLEIQKEAAAQSMLAQLPEVQNDPAKLTMAVTNPAKLAEVLNEEQQAEEERIRNAPTADQLRYIAQNGGNLIETVNPQNPESVKQALDQIYSDKNAARDAALQQDTARLNSTLRVQEEADKAEAEQTREAAIKEAYWPMAEMQGLDRKQFDALKVMSRPELESFLKIGPEEAAKAQAEAETNAYKNANVAEVYTDLFGPEVGKVALSDPNLALDVHQRKQEAEKLAYEQQKKDETQAKMVDFFLKEEEPKLAEMAAAGQIDEAQRIYAEKVKPRVSQLELEQIYLNGVSPAERDRITERKLAEAGKNMPGMEAAIEVTKARLKKQGEDYSAIQGRLQKVDALITMLKNSDLKTGTIQNAIFPLKKLLADAGFSFGDDVMLQEVYDSVSQSLVGDMRVAGEGTMTDTDAKRYLNIIPGLSKTKDGNKLIAQTMRTFDEIASAKYAAEVEYLSEFGIGNDEARQEYIKESLVKRGLMYKDEDGSIQPVPAFLSTEGTTEEEFNRIYDHLPDGRMYHAIDPNTGAMKVYTKGVDDQEIQGAP